MESIIDRVINELVWRLTNSRRAMRASEASELSPSQQPAPPPQAAQPAFAGEMAAVAEPQITHVAEPPRTEAGQQVGGHAETEPADAVVARELQRVVAEAREELESAVELVAQLRASADGFSQRIASMGDRLDELGNGLQIREPAPDWDQQAPPVQPSGFAPAPVAPAPAAATPPAQQAPPAPIPPAPQPPQASPAYPDPAQYAAEQIEQVAVNPTRTLSLAVSSLSNLTVVSVIEAALLRIAGVREVALHQLQGRQAILEVRLDEGTELISGLRRSLPLAFDVTESSDHSLGISLKSDSGHQPQVANGGGGAGATLA